MGDSALGTVLPGQVQGVKEGDGITILPDGTIEVDSQTVRGVMRLGQTAAYADTAFNGYWWPLVVTAADLDKQITIKGIDANGYATLAWADADGIDWTARGQIIAATAAGETNEDLVNIGTDRSFLMSQVDNGTLTTGLAYSDVVTSAMKVPTGSQGQRPATPAVGETRFNTTQGKLEVWDGTEWQTIASENPDDGSFVKQIKSTAGGGQSDVAEIPAGTTAQRITAPLTAGFFRYNTSLSRMEFWDGVQWSIIPSAPQPQGFVLKTSDVGAAVIPGGSNAQRPGSPVAGYFRFNDGPDKMEFWNGSSWQEIASQTSPTPSPIGTVTSVNVSGGTTGFVFTGGPVTSTGTLTMVGILGIGNGGTGANSQPGAINNLLPGQGGNAGRFLTTNGSNVSWSGVNVGVTRIIPGANVSISPAGGTGNVTISASGGLQPGNIWLAMSSSGSSVSSGGSLQVVGGYALGGIGSPYLASTPSGFGAVPGGTYQNYSQTPGSGASGEIDLGLWVRIA